MEHHIIKSQSLSATISAHGAEIQSLIYNNELELIWQADPAYWPRHAPILFPIVGRLSNDTLIHQGIEHLMTQHGFARDMTFDWIEKNSSQCTLQLRHNAESLAKYPFQFELLVSYHLINNRLSTSYKIHNIGDEDLPVSIGAHPAFAWPMIQGQEKEHHVIQFEHPEDAPIRRLRDGLLQTDTFPTPITNQKLALNDSLFIDDAIILDQHRSRQVIYTAPDAPKIKMSFKDFPHLGIWTKPGADFICIEPWQGHSSPTDFTDEFIDKPGIVRIPSQNEHAWQFTIEIEP